MLAGGRAVAALSAQSPSASSLSDPRPRRAGTADAGTSLAGRVGARPAAKHRGRADRRDSAPITPTCQGPRQVQHHRRPWLGGRGGLWLAVLAVGTMLADGPGLAEGSTAGRAPTMGGGKRRGANPRIVASAAAVTCYLLFLRLAGSTPPHPTHAVFCALLGAQAYGVLIGACNPMLRPCSRRQGDDDTAADCCARSTGAPPGEAAAAAAAQAQEGGRGRGPTGQEGLGVVAGQQASPPAPQDGRRRRHGGPSGDAHRCCRGRCGRDPKR